MGERDLALRRALGVADETEILRLRRQAETRIARWRAEGIPAETLALRERREWSLFRDKVNDLYRTTRLPGAWSWDAAVAASSHLYHVAPRWVHPSVVKEGLLPGVYLTTEAGLPMWVQWMMTESSHRFAGRRGQRGPGWFEESPASLRFLNRVRIYRMPVPPIARLSVDSHGTVDAQMHLAITRRGWRAHGFHPALAVAVTAPGGVPAAQLESSLAVLLLEEDTRRRAVRGFVSVEGPFMPIVRS